MENNYKISQNEKVSVWRFSLNPFAILMVIALCISGIAYGQATVKTLPIMNEDGKIQISKDETVTITVMNAVIGETYRLRDDDSKTIVQTVVAESDIVKFEKLTFNKTGTMNYRVFDLSLALLIDLKVEVTKKPQSTERK
jgi:hypothetical protein